MVKLLACGSRFEPGLATSFSEFQLVSRQSVSSGLSVQRNTGLFRLAGKARDCAIGYLDLPPTRNIHRKYIQHKRNVSRMYINATLYQYVLLCQFVLLVTYSRGPLMHVTLYFVFGTGECIPTHHHTSNPLYNFILGV